MPESELSQIYCEAAAGRFPPPDGVVSLLPSPCGPARAAVLAMVNHHVVAADVTQASLTNALDGSVGAPMSPGFIVALEHHLRLHADSVDVLLAAQGLGGQSRLASVGGDAHARVLRARRARTNVEVFECGGVIVILGRGVAGRREIAIEVGEAARGRGAARAALAEALRLLEPIFAQVAPGHGAALRACIAAGFTPVGGEVLFFADVVGD